MQASLTWRSVRRLAERILRPPVAAFLGILLGWQFLSFEQPAYLLPGPGPVLTRLWELTVVQPTLWDALELSLGALLVGGALAFAVGGPLGISMGANGPLERAVGPYANALYVAPVSALTPLFVWWFGVGLEPRIATVFVFSAPVIILTCYRGARETPRTMVEVARVYGAGPLQVFRSVVLPHALPYIVTATRLGLGRAIKGTVLAELVISITGLGELLSGYAHVFDTASLMASVIFLILLGVILQAIVARVEIAVAPWRQQAA